MRRLNFNWITHCFRGISYIEGEYYEWMDLVVINTPVASHFEYTKQVLQAGKHAIVEKHLLPQYPKTKG
jgi:hypothetical protein